MPTVCVSARLPMPAAVSSRLTPTMADDHPALQRFVDQAGSLYSLPMVAVDILQLTSQPKVDLAALKVCLLRDPRWSARFCAW